MGLRDVERRIERGVEGAMGRIFRTSVNRIEVAKRLERELDAGVRSGRLGTPVMPNDIGVRLNPRDVDRLGVPVPLVERELVRRARQHARAAESGFDGPLVVRVSAVDTIPVGTMEVSAVYSASVDGIPPGTLVSPSGYRLDLAGIGTSIVSIGRDVSSDVVVDDERVSRRHARLRPTERGWVLEDLESTNGTRVNGFRTQAQLLSDGDTISIGASTFAFEAV
jgi:hypothetical protein